MSVIATQLRLQAEKRMKTVLFGAVARFEDAFGVFWGLGKPDADCSPEELVAREIWGNCRKAVLDHGHNQMRELARESTT